MTPRVPTGGGVRTDDWAAQATDGIVKVVGVASEKIGQVQTVAKAIVYGLFAGIVANVLAVVAIIMVLRFINVYLPDAVFGEDHMWVAYVLLGAIFTVGGLVLWSKRNAAPDAT